MIPAILIALFLGAFLGMVVTALSKHSGYNAGWEDCEAHQRRHYIAAIDRLAAAHRDNIAQVIGTIAPLPESDEVLAERARRDR